VDNYLPGPKEAKEEQSNTTSLPFQTKSDGS
jgi:hypothetical protein